MLDLSNYPKFQRDIEGHVQALELMVVIGWDFNNTNGPNANGFYTNDFGGPKIDSIFISQVEQTWGTWDFSTASEWQKIKDAYETVFDDAPQYNNDDDIPIFWYDFGLKIPHFEERVDIFQRKYSINDVTFKLSNADNNDISGGMNLWGIKNVGMINNVSTPFINGRIKGKFKFTDVLKIRAITNENVVIFLKSPSAKEWKDLLPIYTGIVTSDNFTSDNVSISLENVSEIKVNNQYPSTLMSSLGASTLEKNQDNPIPMVYGNVDKSPAHYARVPFENFDGSSWVSTGHQDIFYLDTQPLKQLVDNPIIVGTQSIHQSYLYFWDETYWNVSQHTADSEGNEVFPEDGGVDNFWENSDRNQIFMIGSAQQSAKVEYGGNLMTLQQYGLNHYGNDANLDLLYDLYYGTSNAEDEENTGDGGNNEVDLTPANLFNLQNDTVKGKLRVHGFAKPENVNVRVSRGGKYWALTQPLSIKSYDSHEAHLANNPDLTADMKKAYNWSGPSPDTSSFVELSGRLIARYSHWNGYRTFEYPTFSVDFGNGTLPFKNYEVITDTAYHMKSVLQCTHPAPFGIYTGDIGVWADIGVPGVAGHNPAVQHPISRDTFLPKPGGVSQSYNQEHQWVVDTIDGNDSNLVTDYDMQIDRTNIFNNTSQYAQQEGELRVGPVECALHSNFVDWYAGNMIAHTAESYNDGCHCTVGPWTNESSCNFHESLGEWTCVDDAGNSLGYNYIDATKGSGWDFTMRLYHISAFSTIIVEKDEGYDFYANISGRIGNISENMNTNFITLPHGILYNIARTEFKVPYMEDADLWNTGQYANDAVIAHEQHESLNMNMGFSINKQMSGKELIEGIAKSSMLVPSFDSLGRFKLNTLKRKYFYQDAIPIDSNDVIKFNITRTSIEKVYTKVVLKYHFNYRTEEYGKTIEKTTGDLHAENRLSAANANDDGDAVVYDYNYSYFNFNSEDDKVLLLESPYIRSEEELHKTGFSVGGAVDKSATSLANFLLSFYANQHTIFKLTVPFGKYLHIEIGDVVRLTELLGEGNVYSYGEDYTKIQIRNGQYIYPAFYVTKVKKRLDKGIEIECVQMHYLNIDTTATNDHGWVVPDDPEFLIFGCLDDGTLEDSPYPGYTALNYDPNANVPVPCIYRGDLDSSGRIDWLDVALMQLTISDNDILLGIDPGTVLFKQQDMNQDSIIDIKDIYELAIIIMDNVQEDNYGCMDCGDPHGMDWGPEEWPVANNCDWDALVHDQTMCEYSLYGCGPNKYDLNWCLSDIQAYDESGGVCMGVSSENADYDWDDIKDIEDVYFKTISEGYSDSGNDIYSNWEFAINPEYGLGNFSKVNEHGYPAIGVYGGAWNYQTGYQYDHDPLSKIHMYWGSIEDDEGKLYPHDNEAGSFFDEDQGYSDDFNIIHPTMFMRTILKAGHRYMFIPNEEDEFESALSIYNGALGTPNGYGWTLYIGSWQQYQLPIGAPASANPIPTYNMATLASVRLGIPNAWGEMHDDSSGFFYENPRVLPKVFTAEQNAQIIPMNSDDVGKNTTYFGSGYNEFYLYNDYFSSIHYLRDYFMSPDRSFNDFRGWWLTNDMMDSDDGTGMTLGQSYYDARGCNALWAGNTNHHYGISSGGSEDEMDNADFDSNNGTGYAYMNGDLLPFGTRYETNICLTFHIPLASMNMPYGAHAGLIDDVYFEYMFGGYAWTLVDLTENPEFEESILAKLGYCNNSAYGNLTNGGG